MIDYSEFTLSNGLRVVHNYDASTAMVAVNIIYNVGARDESAEQTGLAHLIEHMMFGGSVHIADFDGEMERAGGSDNAWTSNDFTNFYDVAPAANLDTLLWLESDRMLGLSFERRVLDVQKSVVIEEFKQTHLNRPYGDLEHHLRSLIYTSHPYRVPTIGRDISHIRSVTLDDVRCFFFSHYAPNNAVIAISGNVELERVREAVERWFGDIPRRDIAPRRYGAEPEVLEPRCLRVRGHVPQPVVVVAFPMAAYGEPGYIEADIITDILASGRSSRFYRELVMGDALFTQADASISGSDERGFLMLRGHLTDGSDEAVERAIGALYGRAAALGTVAESVGGDASGLRVRELERAVNRFASNQSFTMLTCPSRAQELAMAVMRGEDINARVAAYRGVTPDGLAAVAREVLEPSHACTLVYLPE